MTMRKSQDYTYKNVLLLCSFFVFAKCYSSQNQIGDAYQCIGYVKKIIIVSILLFSICIYFR